MPTLARIPCLIPALTLILLILQIGCGSSDAEMEFYLRTDENTVAANEFIRGSNDIDIKYYYGKAVEYPENVPLILIAEAADKIVDDFDDYIEGVRHELINLAKGPEPEPWDKSNKVKDRMALNYKNKKIADNYFLSDKKTRAIEIKNKIIETRRQILNLIDTDLKKIPINIAYFKPEEIQHLKKNIPLGAEESFSKSGEGNRWEYSSFHQVPLAKALVILSGLQSQARISGSMIINSMSVNMYAGGDGFPKYYPMSSPEKGYATVGKKFSTDIFLASTEKILSDSVTIKVNGVPIPVEDGIGHYEVRAKKAGENVYRADITIVNLRTNKSETYTKTFKYYVGQPSQ